MKNRITSYAPVLMTCSLAVLFCLSCEFFKPGEPIDFTTVENYSNLPYPLRANFVFQDSATLRNFWIENSFDTLFMQVPQVDFNTSTLICVFMGRRLTGGYVTTVEEVRAFDDELVVAIRETDWHGVIQIVTYPCHLVTISKTSLPIKFEYREKVDFGAE